MLSIISLVVVLIANLVLGVVVLVNNPKVLLNRVFSMLVTLLPAWSIVVFLEDPSIGQAKLGILTRLDFMLGTILLVLFYWFVGALTRKGWRVLDVAVPLIGLTSFIMAVFGLMSTPMIENGDLVL